MPQTAVAAAGGSSGTSAGDGTRPAGRGRSEARVEAAHAVMGGRAGTLVGRADPELVQDQLSPLERSETDLLADAWLEKAKAERAGSGPPAPAVRDEGGDLGVAEADGRELRTIRAAHELRTIHTGLHTIHERPRSGSDGDDGTHRPTTAATGAADAAGARVAEQKVTKVKFTVNFTCQG